MIRKAERKHDLPIKLNEENLEEKCIVSVIQCLPNFKSSYTNAVFSIPNYTASCERIICALPLKVIHFLRSIEYLSSSFAQ